MMTATKLAALRMKTGPVPIHAIRTPAIGYWIGWCYGSGPLVNAARSVEGLAVAMHGGGMLAGTARQLITPGLREFILGHVERITALTRQPFHQPFTEGLLGDPTAMLDSEPPTAAILAAQAVAGRGLAVGRDG